MTVRPPRTPNSLCRKALALVSAKLTLRVKKRRHQSRVRVIKGLARAMSHLKQKNKLTLIQDHALIFQLRRMLIDSIPMTQESPPQMNRLKSMSHSSSTKVKAKSPWLFLRQSSHVSFAQPSSLVCAVVCAREAPMPPQQML